MLSRFIPCVISVVLSSPVFADAASIFDYWLGDHIIDYPLSELDVVSSDLDGFGGQAFIKLNAPNATHVVLTFRQPRNTLQYLEHDWIDRSSTAPTALGLPGISEFTFGQTRVSEIQSALGQQGYHYACRQLLPSSGRLLTFVSFEISSRENAVYTLVAESSQALADRGRVDPKNIDLSQAVLVAAIVSRPQYLNDFWCEERIEYTATPSLPAKKIPADERFEDFLPSNMDARETAPWRVVTDPFLMVEKDGALSGGDLLHIMPNGPDCSDAQIMVSARTYDDDGLLALEGKDVDGAFNLLLAQQQRVPLIAPVPLAYTLFAPSEERFFSPFPVGIFVLENFDFERLIATETNPSALGFSLEFSSGVAGLQDNYWSLEELFKAGNEVLQLCRESLKLAK